MAETLNVETRQPGGKLTARRLRKAGSVPGVLYGHGEENACLTVPRDALDTLVFQGSRLVQLTGAVDESAFIREVQWDVWGTHVIHVDFTRIAEGEKVQVRVTVELRGEAPGVREGGVVEHLIHEVDIECPAIAIPERIRVNVNSLKLEESLTVADLELPEDATILRELTDTVVQCVVPMEAPEEEAEGAGEGEPEVIGAKEEEDEGSKEK